MSKEINKTNNIITQFGKLFQKKDNYPDTDNIPKTEYKGYMDKTNVTMIIPKKQSIKTILLSEFEVEEQKIPELDYHNDTGLINTSKYSCEYLGMMLQLCKHEETIKISVKSDYPIKLETDDLILIIAPRCDNN